MKYPSGRDPLIDYVCERAMRSIRRMTSTFPAQLPDRANDRARLAVKQYKALMALDMMAEYSRLLYGRTLRSLGPQELPPGTRQRDGSCVIGRTRKGKAFVTSAWKFANRRAPGKPSCPRPNRQPSLDGMDAGDYVGDHGSPLTDPRPNAQDGFPPSGS